MYGEFRSTNPRQQMPIINVLVNLENGHFSCVYNLSKSLNTLNTPECSLVMDDKHFDNIVGKFENQAKWLSQADW